MKTALSTLSTLSIAALVVGIHTAVAGQSPATNDRLVATFLGQLQRAVDQRDRRAVAAMIRYPITVLVSGWQIPVGDPTRLVTMYDLFFTPETRCLIVESRVPRPGEAPPLNPVVVLSDGLSLGEGRIWAQRSGATFKITRLIVPPAPTIDFKAQAPRRVGPASALRPARFTGILKGDAVESFVLSAREGQVLQAGISGFRGSDATVRVFDQKSGKPLEARTPDGGRTWRGVVPASAEYRIDVVRLAPYCDPPLQYLLAVTLR